MHSQSINKEHIDINMYNCNNYNIPTQPTSFTVTIYQNGKEIWKGQAISWTKHSEGYEVLTPGKKNILVYGVNLAIVVQFN